MFKKVILAIILFALMLTPCIIWMQNLEIVLFLNSAWFMPVVIVIGTVVSLIRAVVIKKKGSGPAAVVEPRHTIDSFLEHWGTAIGIMILIISGFQIRSGSNALFGMNLHYLGLFITLGFGSYFLTNFFIHNKYNTLLPSVSDIIDGTLKKYLLRAQWKDEGKYLSSQKSAILAFTFLGIGILLTGAAKMGAHFWDITPLVVQLATSIHDFLAVFFVLMFLVHVVLVILVRSHRMLLPSWFTGRAPEYRVKKEKLEPRAPPESEVAPATVDSNADLDPA